MFRTPVLGQTLQVAKSFQLVLSVGEPPPTSAYLCRHCPIDKLDQATFAYCIQSTESGQWEALRVRLLDASAAFCSPLMTGNYVYS